MQNKKKKTQNFPSNAKFCTWKKGLISLNYLPTHASSWNVDNGTHSIIAYGSSIVVMLIFMSCEKFKLWVSPPIPSKLQIIVHIELEERLKGQMMKQKFEMSFENAIMQLHWQIFVWILWHYVVLIKKFTYISNVIINAKNYNHILEHGSYMYGNIFLNFIFNAC